jgi:hypothetical protein
VGVCESVLDKEPELLTPGADPGRALLSFGSSARTISGVEAVLVGGDTTGKVGAVVAVCALSVLSEGA